MTTGADDALTPHRRPWVLTAGVTVIVTIGALTLAWRLTHVPPLPLSQTRITATTTVGAPVYLGVFAVPTDFGREITVRSVGTSVTESVQASVTVLVCVGGSIGVTTTPAPFCSRLEPATGATLGPGDDLVLEVTADRPGAVVLDPVEISYRQGWRRGTQPAGAPSVVRILAS